ncbi:MAG: hypothetical protein IJD01_08300, partial [Clostridia bacterium]|nr:hypothetical protein [Clostridia bacterium]
GEYYLSQKDGSLAVDGVYWVNNKNDLITETAYWFGFDADGKMIKDGFVVGGDGYTYYFVDTNVQRGFTKVGNDYYFFNAASGKMYKDTTLYVKANDYGVKAGMYKFDANGKLVMVTYTAETVTAAPLKAGDTVEVKVYASSAFELSMMELHLRYDNAVLKPVNGTAADYLTGFAMNAVNVAPLNDANGVYVTAMDLSAKAVGNNVLLATITFEALTDIDADTVITADHYISSDLDATPFNTAYVNGGIVIEA